MAGSSMLPFYVCVAPALALIGFVIVAIGISSRQPKMTKWGVALLVLIGVAVLVALILSGVNRR